MFETLGRFTLLRLYLSILILSGCQVTSTPTNVVMPEIPITSTPRGATPTTTMIPTATEELCENDAVFIADLTIPDFSEVMPGESLGKSWQIRNTGSCAWGTGYYVVFREGHAMTERLQHALYPARPETNAVVQIDMTAPNTPGDYQGFWRLYDPNGKVFGHKLFIKIKVTSVSTTSTAP